MTKDNQPQSFSYLIGAGPEALTKEIQKASRKMNDKGMESLVHSVCQFTDAEGQKKFYALIEWVMM